MGPTIRVACACGLAFRVRPVLAGKSVACPKCKTKVAVPAASPPAAARRPATSRATRRVPGPPSADPLKYEAGVRGIAMYVIIAGLCILGGGLGAWAMVGEQASVEFLASLGPMLVLGTVVTVVGFGVWIYQGWSRWSAIAVLAGYVAVSVYQMQTAQSDPKAPPRAIEIQTASVAIMAAWHCTCIIFLLMGSSGRIFTAEYRRQVASRGEAVSVPMMTSAIFWFSALFSLLAILAVVSMLGLLGILVHERGVHS